MKLKSVELSVVGLQYRVTPATRRRLKTYLDGGPIRVSIEREPMNVHDENAIKVVIAETPYAGLHIGYLMREVAEVYAPELDLRRMKKVQAWLTDLMPDEALGTINMQWEEATRKKTQGKRKKSGKQV